MKDSAHSKLSARIYHIVQICMHDDLVFKVEQLRNAYYEDASADNYNELMRVTKLLAHACLVDAAARGHAQAAIELAKLHTMKPDIDIDKLEEIWQYKDLPEQFLNSLVTLKKEFSKQHGVETAKDVLKIWREGKIDDARAEKMLQILAREKELTEKREVDQKMRIELFLTKDEADAV